MSVFEIDNIVYTASGNGNVQQASVIETYHNYTEFCNAVKVSTNLGYSLITTPNHLYFADFINGQSKNKYYTYLMQKDNWFRVGMASWYRGKGKNIVPGFKARGNQERADAMWVLEICSTKEEASYYEQFYSVKYGLPTWLFRTSGRGYRLLYDETSIENLFNAIDTFSNGNCLLKHKDYDIERPHYSPKCMNKRERRNFSITICADARYNPLHRYSISGSEESDKHDLENVGIETRYAKNKRGWRIEKMTSDLSVVYTQLKKIKFALSGPVNVIEKGSFSKRGTRNLRIMPASQVLPGMFVYVYHNDEIVMDEVLSNERIIYTNVASDIYVDRTHNYIANNIVVYDGMLR